MNGLFVWHRIHLRAGIPFVYEQYRHTLIFKPISVVQWIGRFPRIILGMEQREVGVEIRDQNAVSALLVVGNGWGDVEMKISCIFKPDTAWHAPHHRTIDVVVEKPIPNELIEFPWMASSGNHQFADGVQVKFGVANGFRCGAKPL